MLEVAPNRYDVNQTDPQWDGCGTGIDITDSIVVDGTRSEFVGVDSGVPQDSALELSLTGLHFSCTSTTCHRKCTHSPPLGRR